MVSSCKIVDIELPVNRAIVQVNGAYGVCNMNNETSTNDNGSRMFAKGEMNGPEEVIFNRNSTNNTFTVQWQAFVFQP